VRRDERRIDVDGQGLRGAVQIPEALARCGMRRSQGVDEIRIGADLLDQPVGGGVRRNLPEEGLLLAHHSEV
jgi:hypothetical protein